MEGSVVCPVCTLYLRPGMTLKSHLESHPKQKVIEALVKLHSEPPKEEVNAVQSDSPSDSQTNQQWLGNNACLSSAPSLGPGAAIPLTQVATNTPGAGTPGPSTPGNHSFFYQQFMSSSTPQPASYVNQQYVTIPIFNQQMIPQYVYQQQQVFVSSGPSVPKLLPIADVSNLEQQNELESANDLHPHIVELHDDQDEKDDDDPDMESVEAAKIPIIVSTANIDDELVTEEIADVEIVEEMPELQSEVHEHVLDVDGKTVLEKSDCSTSTECEELDKSCQTQTSEEPPQLERQVPMDMEKFEGKPVQLDIEVGPRYITLTNHSDQDLEMSRDADHNNFDMDGMNLILGQEYVQSQSQMLPSNSEDFDYSSNASMYKYERPRILMNMSEFSDNRDENISVESVNMRSDENMPARGELSGQESNASDVASWSRLQYHEGSSRMSTGMSTYDLLARESWEGSDVSDTDAPPPYQSRNPPYIEADNDDVMISGSSRQGIEYKCTSCDMSFICPKERRVHQAEVHGANSAQNQSTSSALESPNCVKNEAAPGVNLIGAQLFKKSVKKLVIKPKQTQATLKTEAIDGPFDHIFNNIMKVEEGANQQTKTEETAKMMQSISSTLSNMAMQPIIICVICCAVMKDGITLRQHQVEVHAFGADTKYKCGVCQESFASEPPYSEHLAVHPLECQFCGKYFYRSHNMQLHIKRHMGIRPFKCNTCDKMFLTRQKLQEHRHVHTGEAPLKCNMCSETFKRHSNLIQHRNRHHLMLKKKVKDFICSTCGEVFHSKKKLAWHKEIHENKPKSCVHCSEKFIHASSLTRHVRRAHNERFVPQEERDRENVECPICKGIYLKTSLEAHIKSHSGTKNYTCSVCDKDFTTKWNLKLHKWTHAGRAQKPYKCELCKGAFVREPDYTAHMNSHKSIRPYTCNHCGAQFIRKYNCQRHVKEHERVKTFSCNICGKTFHRSYYLNDHMRIHSGVRPFSCHICGKTSTTKSNHNKHVRIHHAREPVSTEN